jgi:N-formylglutamate deformylase
LARKDTDWWIEKLYDFAEGLGATVIRTSISRTLIDVNRDPSGASLYPGQTTTGLCPTETFDGEPVYRLGSEPGPADVDRRCAAYFVPYHQALEAEIARLRALHEKIVLYDCHSIRSVLPRLFDGRLPVFNLGTNKGASADPALEAIVSGIMAGSGESFVANGRFTGGWITRRHGRPADGVHALQMELANRGYLREPDEPGQPDNWPVAYDAEYAAPIQSTLKQVLEAALAWAKA